VRITPAVAVTLIVAGAFSGSAQPRDNLPRQDLSAAPRLLASHVTAAQVTPARAESQPAAGSDELTTVVRTYCRTCHNDRSRSGNLSLEGFEIGTVAQSPRTADTAEKMIRKLRAKMMPPPGAKRPEADTLRALVDTLEATLDNAAAANPNPGHRTFQRLNRAEYARAVRDLLSLEINAGDFLPLDTMSANFDNIADVQILSPTLLDGYLKAAAEISRLAVGNAAAAAIETTYTKSRTYSQWDWVEGAPYGTRGGITVVHNFPADGEYVFKMAFQHTTTGGVSGSTIRGEQIEIAINGERVALMAMDQFVSTSDPQGVNLETEAPIFVKAGPQRVSAAFLRQFDGPVEDLLAPHDWSIVDTEIGDKGYGITTLPHMKALAIAGPSNIRGVSDTPSRRRIFTCKPVAGAEERCARQILATLVRRAYRGQGSDDDVERLMGFFRAGRQQRDFDRGIQVALQRALASPKFVFRVEREPDQLAAGRIYRLSDLELASRLSFFLWSSIPDDALLKVAAEDRLREPAVLEREVRRMLADSKSERFVTNFAGQWLYLRNLTNHQPNSMIFPDFDDQLRQAFRREAELFFDSIVREDRNVLDLMTADYTFVNERLASHYGIPNVYGSQFRRVTLTDDARKGLLGKGAILTVTSRATRTSPVVRGKWILDNILNAPPPPPLPDVPPLPEPDESGQVLSMRERMEAHRRNPVCANCHRMFDPIGLAMENFDAVGRWRARDGGSLGVPIDASGELLDGSKVDGVVSLRRALLRHPDLFVGTVVEKLMTYALGRGVAADDMPSVRTIIRDAAARDDRFSTLVLGIVKSTPFTMRIKTSPERETRLTGVAAR
jgi:cytochrome c5